MFAFEAVPSGRPRTPASLSVDGLRVDGLVVAYRSDGELVVAVGGATFQARPGRIVGLAGESGSGKTTACLAAIGYLPPAAALLGGESVFDGVALLGLDTKALRRLWGREISYVGQDAAVALNPARRIGSQLTEILRVNARLSRAEAHQRALELLEAVHLPGGARVLRRYPHELSGGQLQRVAIAMAIAPNPRLIIFDEPTTGLDVITQADVLRTLDELVRARGLAAIYISHDLALLSAISDELVIFYAGEVVESGPTKALLAAPRHPYTRALLDALPSARRALRPKGIDGVPPGHFIADACAFSSRCPYVDVQCTSTHPDLVPLDSDRLVRCLRSGELGVLPSRAASLVGRRSERQGAVLLEIRDLVCTYGKPPDEVRAVDGVSLKIHEGQVVGLVGETGSGKSTIGRAIVGLVSPRGGTITWAGRPLPEARARPKELFRQIQIVFQNPETSLNPRHTVGQLIERAVALFRDDVAPRQRAAIIADALRAVQLDPALARRYPHQLSGGEKQRVAIARAFVVRPRLVICDEIISGLDVSAQATILELVRQMQLEHGTALLFISHDLAAVRSIAEWVYVIRDGHLEEEGPTERLFEAPTAAYTRRLLSAVFESEGTGGETTATASLPG
jgi:peptide/nickel transport system ATP-binding protein